MQLSLSDPKCRAFLFQLIALSLLAAGIYEIYHNIHVNLASRGIASGFDFLSSTAGFNIIQHLVGYTESDTYGRVFWVGLLNTILVSGLGIVIATTLGFVIGISRLSQNWLLAKIAYAYVETIRNIPLLLQIFFWYFVVLRAAPHPRQAVHLWDWVFLTNRGVYLPEFHFPEASCWLYATTGLFLILSFFVSKLSHARQQKTGRCLPTVKINLSLAILLILIPICIMLPEVTVTHPVLKGFNFRGGILVLPELLALLAALSTYTAAFIAEIVRAGIVSVSKGQKEAAAALGLTNAQKMRLVILPQAMRVIIPPLTNQFLNLTKNSSLAAAIAYPDLVSVFAGTVLNQTGQAVEVISITMGVYLTLSLSIALMMNLYQRRHAWKQ